jgi:hypothetical protein
MRTKGQSTHLSKGSALGTVYLLDKRATVHKSPDARSNRLISRGPLELIAEAEGMSLDFV